MDKEELLKKAQEENNGADLADLNVQYKATYLSYFIGIFGIVLVDIINAIVLKSVNHGANFVISAMVFVAFLYKYIKLKKKHELFVSGCYFTLSVMFLVFWILQLAKVW